MNNKKRIAASIAILANRRFGWDGKDAAPIRPDVARWSRDTLFADFDAVGLYHVGLDRVELPTVDLTTRGAVRLGLRHGRKLLQLVIECGGVISYVQLFPDKVTTVSGVARLSYPAFNPEEIRALNAMILWLVEE